VKRTLITVGNSTAVTLPSDLLERYGLKPGDAVEVSQGEAGIVVAPLAPSLAPEVERAVRAVFTEHREVFRQLAEHDRRVDIEAGI
jgi:putative addiction module antidote